MALAKRLGDYEIVAPIGRGGAGTVFRCRSPRTGAGAASSDVAIKVLAGGKPEALARFERERRLQSSLGEDEGFVPLLGGGASPEGPYIVMPLLTGGTLRERLAKGPFDEEEAIALGSVLAATLGRAHERGIVHRDLKPENVIYTGDGRALVADLGLAKHFAVEGLGASQSVGLSQTGEFRGTAGYMAPEQAKDAREVGPEADVFSLGAILYECLTGEPAFSGDSIFEVLGKVESGELRSLVSLKPGTPRWLQALVARALERDPKKRFRDGTELARAFAERREPSRSWALPVVGVALLAALGVGGVALASHLEARALAKKAASVEEAIAAGRKLEIAGELAKAAAAYGRAIEADPLSASAWANRGRVKAKLGDPDGVIQDCTRAIELDPKSVGPWGNRAFAKERKGDFDGAIADDTKAIELEPDLGTLWHNRAQARADKNDAAGALKDYTRALELDRSLKDAWYSRGELEIDMGSYDAAIADLTKAIELVPGNAHAWLDRGKAKQLSRDFEGALADFSKALELDEKLEGAWVRRGEVRRQLREYQGSADDFGRAIALRPNEGAYWYGRGAARELARNGPDALVDYEKTLTLETTEAIATGARDGIARIKAWKKDP